MVWKRIDWDRLEAIKKAYHSQGYGRTPPAEGDEELKKLLANK